MMPSTTYANEVQHQIAGVVLYPGDPGYTEEIAAFNLAIEHRPDIVGEIESAQDASAAIRYAAAAAAWVLRERPSTAEETGPGDSK